ncbi:unnamed protein product, partial [Aphanomyces euteiches]
HTSGHVTQIHCRHIPPPVETIARRTSEGFIHSSSKRLHRGKGYPHRSRSFANPGPNWQAL